MEIVSVFTYRVDLAVRLVDTTSGKTLSGKSATVLIDGEPYNPTVKPDECMVFQNIGKTNFHLTVQENRFEDAELDVDLEQIPGNMPLIDLQMVPRGDVIGFGPLFVLEGNLPGICSLHAVRLADKSCVIRNFEIRTKRLQLFNPRHCSMERVEYALVNPKEKVFEPFKVRKQINDQCCELDRKLTMKFQNDFPVTPLISGKVFPDGSYCLRVRNDGQDARWLVRWTVKDENQAYFHTVDFRQDETVFLKGDDG